ncbi:pimeloyl-[acyl-carrier protein] methyl ester esterase [Aliidiomarina minuta]|uniref:Pimeloyl-[acyl-carrier protein] methyl ester esterase n=1 Tax=Aliidiomarina minuta TaxID=880057 RepID=A0A432W9R9_9GAMM|nr:pimeloyl-ACP methyl ester esterase BioH [Aliidiomarina minuta]RUO26791.1 pimeloyl-[acyl-carrier protein] methyl ester esterase [Aliidiomarina minuta]
MTQSYLHAEVQGQGEDLVLLHGWGLNCAVWQKVSAALETRYRVHAIDLPGFGDSAWKAGYQDIAQVAKRLEQYLTDHCHGPAVVLGWSLGGLLATLLAIHYPDKLTRLHTVASSPCFVRKDNWPGIQESVLEDFKNQLNTDYKSTIKRFLAVQAMGSPSARDDVKLLRQQLQQKPHPHPQALEAGLNWLQHTDLRKQIEQLKVPLQRSYGRLDSLVPVQVSKQLTKLPEDQDVKIFENSAHAPFLNQFKDFIDMLS